MCANHSLSTSSLSADSYRLAFERALVGSAVLSSCGVVLEVNPAFARLLARQPEHLIGRTLLEFLHADDRHAASEALGRVLEGESGSYENVMRFVTCDGRAVPLRLQAASLPEGSADPLLLLQLHPSGAQEAGEILHGEVKAALERRVAQRTEELAAANNEMEAFAYSVAHDLRGPLRALDGFSAALLEDYAGTLDATATDYLNRIRRASQAMGMLIDDMLRLSRIGRSEVRRQPVDLVELARTALQSLTELEPDRDVEVVLPARLMVVADERLLSVALQNLFSNAWKFTRGRHPARIELGATDQERGRVYFIRDNGVGFDMRFADNLFRAFQRLHAGPEFEGNGIGLAIVRRVLHRHGGDVWAESTPGHGATFYFTLPELAS